MTEEKAPAASECVECTENCTEQCEKPGACEQEPEVAEAQDDSEGTPDLQQTSLTVCSMMIAELRQANEKYPPFFRSSREALGVLVAQFEAVKEMALKIKAVDGYALDVESFNNGPLLLPELVQLGAMCIKASYSLCNLQSECEKFSSELRKQQAMAEMIYAAEQAENDEPVESEKES